MILTVRRLRSPKKKKQGKSPAVKSSLNPYPTLSSLIRNTRVAGDALRSRVILPRLGPLAPCHVEIAALGRVPIANRSCRRCHHNTTAQPKKIWQAFWGPVDALRCLLYFRHRCGFTAPPSLPVTIEISCAFPATSCRYCVRLRKRPRSCRTG